MEGKLFEAACSGDIDVLYDAVRGDAAILQKLHSWGSTDTPLHLASMFGHAEFVREHIRLSSISAHQLSQLNQDGFSPLHLASANGHMEIVQFLLEFGKQKSVVEELCMKKDRDGRTALHSAVVTGKIDVIDLLFVHCPKAAKEVTLHQESVLHLAVKHHQQEVLEFLIDQKLGPSVQDLLNRGDRQGNTVLHLATAKKQLQIVEYLVKQSSLNANAENSNGVKPLDILFVSAALNSNDMYIEEAIRLAGGCRSQMTNVTTSPPHNTPYSLPESFNKVEDWLKEMRNGIIVMSSVFATLSFQVALTPPGGLWQDWGPNGAQSNNSFVPTRQPGVPILYDLDRKRFNSTNWLNTVTFFTSIASILLMRQPFKVQSPGMIMLVLHVVLVTILTMVVEFIRMAPLLTKKSFKDMLGTLTLSCSCL
ncbi:hypothetical protein Salat_2428300 [Sesamum alatum]|uniref:PGG domain-containing protein n=1 Tax=Sesamum alatum TaxID=300844 RepID=A0AAE2CFE8_9LAMI|nr:hypothetical protein Salat_2428300 [Sesamum alatum]